MRDLAEKLARDRRTLAVLAATRLWLPSTALMRDAPPADRAVALSKLAIRDLFEVWKAHGLHFAEKAFNLAVHLLISPSSPLHLPSTSRCTCSRRITRPTTC